MKNDLQLHSPVSISQILFCDPTASHWHCWQPFDEKPKLPNAQRSHFNPITFSLQLQLSPLGSHLSLREPIELQSQMSRNSADYRILLMKIMHSIESHKL